MAHRGPDGEGTWVDGSGVFGFSHRRLSIIDLSEAGAQPMWSVDKALCITFNGEIYNYKELREELELLGAGFRSRSDTEVLLEAYRYWGKEMLSRLDGMFAFAIYDSRDCSFFLARDPFGEKPLYYSITRSRFAFASELTALCRVYDFNSTILTDEISKYLALGYFDGESTPYSGAKKLLPGHYAIFDIDRNFKIRRYFKFSPSPEQTGRTIDDYADELENILLVSLSRRLRSDVPVGAFLSGGVDSSLVSALAARKLGANLKTFSIGYKGAGESEHVKASEIAAHLGIEHSVKMVLPKDMYRAEEIAKIVDEPNGDGSLLPTYVLSKFARKEVKVAISGDGADELFGGYSRYFKNISDENCQVSSQESAGMRYYKNYILVHREQDIANILPGDQSTLRLYLDTLRKEIDDFDGSLIGALRSTDIEHYLPGDILAKVDRMSMRNGLEVRTPFLNTEVARFAEKLPEEMLANESSGKLVIKQLASRYLPRSWVDRPKQGFGIPTRKWSELSLSKQVNNAFFLGPDRYSWWIRRASCKKWYNEIIENRDNATYKLWTLLHIQKYFERGEGFPAEKLDLLSSIELKKVIKPLKGAFLGLSLMPIKNYKALYPGLDNLMVLYGGGDEDTQFDWINVPKQAVIRAGEIIGRSVRTIVLLNEGGYDDRIVEEFKKAGVNNVIQYCNGDWCLEDLKSSRKKVHTSVPLLFDANEGMPVRFDADDMKRSFKSLFLDHKHNEDDSNDIFLKRPYGGIGYGTPWRGWQLAKEIVAWGRQKYRDRLFFKWLRSVEVNNSYPNNKRVALVIDTLSPGGAERQLCTLAKGLKYAGFTVRVFTILPLLGSSAHYHQLLKEIDIEVVAANSVCDKYIRDDLELESIKRVLEKTGLCPHFLQKKIWALYTHLMTFLPSSVISFLDTANVVAGVSSRLAHIPTHLFSFRGHSPDNFITRNGWYKGYYKKLSHLKNIRLTGNSHAGNESYANWLNICRNDILLIYNGIDFSMLPEADNDEITSIIDSFGLCGAKVVVGIFRLTKEKQPEAFIRVIKEVSRVVPNIKAVIVGEGPLRAELERLIYHLELKDKVFLPGNKNNVVNYISISDVVLQTSKFEGTPNSLIEAQYLGKPVVTTAAGGASEAIYDQKTGYVSHSGTIEELSRFVLELLNDSELSHRKGAAGISFVKSRFSVDRMIQQYLELLEYKGC